MNRKLLVLAGSLAALLPHSVLAGETSPPTAPVEVVTDDYYGTKVDDPYRWMESGKDPRWMPWLKAQADHTAAALAKLPVPVLIRFAPECSNPLVLHAFVHLSTF